MKPPPHILLVNPWIHDFAAYDVWAKPYGLLLLAAMLRAHGAKVSYIDCLDRFHPKAAPANPDARGGRGPYRKTPLPAPPGLLDIRRQYSRYGIDPSWFKADLRAIAPPNLVLVTSLMTYWYPGVQETISLIKQIFPKTPVVLGGIYATLCPDHARAHSGADKVAAGATEKNLLDIVFEFTGWRATANFNLEDLDAYPHPAFDLQHHINYIPLLTSRGCPFDCAYCASKMLYTGYDTRSPDSVAREIDYWHTRFGVKNFAFYDDALLVNAEKHAIPLFEKIIALGHPLSFHTPNAVHIRGITSKIAHLMAYAGFKTIRLGLETYRDATRENLDHKTSATEFHQAVYHLMEAGFSKEQVGAYLLVGLPDQDTAEIEASIQMVHKTGISPIPAHYTPIPHTRLWPRAVASSRYDLAADPIFCNNAIFPCSKKPFSWNELSKLKHLAAD
ncbi:MAG: radical SAM protein [Desulfobacterales bacterium]|nr:radical SAM protein [Desulfobacterales bacterium]